MPIATRANLQTPRSLFELFRPAPTGPGVPGIISSLQAYGGLQAWACSPPSQSLGTGFWKYLAQSTKAPGAKVG